MYNMYFCLHLIIATKVHLFHGKEKHLAKKVMEKGTLHP